MDFGAVGDGHADDLPYFQAAHDFLGVGGGILTGPARTYYLSSTFSITNPVTIDFFNAYNTYLRAVPGHQPPPPPSQGAILYSDFNGPILSYAAPTTTRFVGLKNLSIVGGCASPTGQAIQACTAAVASQDGIVVNNMGVRISNVGIFGVGRYGLHIIQSVASIYENMYIQQCGYAGVLVSGTNGGHCGANTWRNIIVQSNGNSGFNVDSADGADTVVGLVCGQNAMYEIVVRNAVGWEFVGTHTEGSASRVVYFGSESNNNRIDFTAMSTSENQYTNCGGSGNVLLGNQNGVNNGCS